MRITTRHDSRLGFHLLICVVFAAPLLARPHAVLAEPVDADILLANGVVFIGDGGRGTKGDVAIKGDRIVAVGDFELGSVGKTINCRGLIVAPGFIDLHNHSDQKADLPKGATGKRRPRILTDPLRQSVCYLTQGCTTVVTGNCGGGVLDVQAYYDQLRERRPGVNVAHLVPQGAVRRRVIGSARRRPSEGEIDQMRDLVRKGMEAGAWGMSTGLAYVPSAYADAEEIIELARVVAEHQGLYASHIRGEGDGLIEAVEEALAIGRGAGLAVHVSHFKASGRRNWGKVRVAAQIIQTAIDDGQLVTADQYPYAASSTSIAAMLLPSREREGGRKQLTERLSDPEHAARLYRLVEDRLAARGAIMVAECPKRPNWVGKMIRDIAADERCSPVEVAIEIISTGDEAGVSFSMDERDVRWVMKLPWVATASDGSMKIDDGTTPHPRSFGTFPRRIGRYSIQEHVVPIAQAIRSATGLPADILRLTDRGYLRVGYVADVVVLDRRRFRDKATFKEPHQLSTGVRCLILNGKEAIAYGEITIVDAGIPLPMPPQTVDSAVGVGG